jgi:hypothetical protein
VSAASRTRVLSNRHIPTASEALSPTKTAVEEDNDDLKMNYFNKNNDSEMMMMI